MTIVKGLKLRFIPRNYITAARMVGGGCDGNVGSGAYGEYVTLHFFMPSENATLHMCQGSSHNFSTLNTYTKA